MSAADRAVLADLPQGFDVEALSFEKIIELAQRGLAQLVEVAKASPQALGRLLPVIAAHKAFLVGMFIFAFLVDQNNAANECDQLSSSNALAVHNKDGDIAIFYFGQLIQVCQEMCRSAINDVVLDGAVNALSYIPQGAAQQIDAFSMSPKEGMLYVCGLVAQSIHNLTEVSASLKRIFTLTSQAHNMNNDDCPEDYYARWQAATAFAVIFGLALGAMAGKKLYDRCKNKKYKDLPTSALFN
jgi:hypothetical protein